MVNYLSALTNYKPRIYFRLCHDQFSKDFKSNYISLKLHSFSASLVNIKCKKLFIRWNTTQNLSTTYNKKCHGHFLIADNTKWKNMQAHFILQWSGKKKKFEICPFFLLRSHRQKLMSMIPNEHSTIFLIKMPYC